MTESVQMLSSKTQVNYVSFQSTRQKNCLIIIGNIDDQDLALPGLKKEAKCVLRCWLRSLLFYIVLDSVT